MPQEEASIRMTVDSSQPLTEYQKLLRAATETSNIIIQKSEQYAGSLKQRAQFIEREIELMREQTRLSTQQQLANIEERRAAGKITAAQAQAARTQVRTEGREDVEELKLVNRQLKQWIAEQRTAQQKNERFGESLTRVLPGVLGANDVGGMVGASTSTLAGIGFVGLLAGIGLTKAMRGAMTMSPAIRDYAILMGKSMLGVIPDVRATAGMNLGEMGLTPSQYFQNYAQLYRAGAGVVKENMLNIMAAEKALGLSRQTTAGLLGVERYGGGTITPVISYFESYLRNTNQSIAVLPEILQQFTTEATAMMRTTGRVDSAAIAASISTVGRAFGLSGEPLNIVYGALRQGLQQSTNPAIQALQFAAMERTMPGASLWQMQMAMENPMQHPQYVVNMLNQMRMMTGGGEMYARTLYNVFGQYGITANLANQLAQGQITPEMFAQQAFGGGRNYLAAAAAATSPTEQATAGWQGWWEREGYADVESIAGKLKELLNSIKDAGEKITITQGDLVNAADALKEEARTTNSKLDKVISAIARGYLYQGATGFSQ